MNEKEFAKKYGDGLLLSGQHLIDNPKKVISFSPAIDIMLGGGVPVGSIVVITGPEKIGKTVSSLHLAAKAQMEGMLVVYFDIEHRIKPRDLLGIYHLNPRTMHLIQSTHDNPLTVSTVLTMATDFLHSDPNCFIVFDSISQFCADSRLETEIGKQQYAPEAAAMADFLRRSRNLISVQDSILVCITQQMANLNSMGAALQETGGRKVKYAMDIRMQAYKREELKVGEQDPYGQRVFWKQSSTALEAGPGRKCRSYIRFGHGIDETMELVDMGLVFAKVKKKGSWYFLASDPDKKSQGENKFRQYLTDNPDKLELLQKEINEAVA
jgi:recombination protein RecA